MDDFYEFVSYLNICSLYLIVSFFLCITLLCVCNVYVWMCKLRKKKVEFFLQLNRKEEFI